VRKKIYEQIFDFFDSKEYSDILLLAHKNRVVAGRMKKYTDIKIPINTLSIVGKRFGIGRTTAAMIQKIKKVGDEEVINDLLDGNISVTEAYAISKGEKSHRIVYFIRDLHSKRIKIGKTKMLNCRYDFLKRCNGGDLELLLTIDGYTKEELSLHKKFNAYLHHGEWFEPAQEILDEIKNLKNLIKKEECYDNNLIS
jgi:hypothetical protein